MNQEKIGFLTPRTRQSSFLIPYFFDGTNQYVFVKKNNQDAIALIEAEEKDRFQKAIADSFTFVDEASFLVKKNNEVNVAQVAGYSFVAVDIVTSDTNIEEKVKKEINLIKKTVYFIPIFYTIEQEELFFYVDKNFPKDIPEQKDAIANAKAGFFKGLQKDIEAKMAEIIENNFHDKDIPFVFNPFYIPEQGNNVALIQLIQISTAINAEKQYSKVSLEDVLQKPDYPLIKTYIKKIYEKSKADQQLKIDEQFKNIFNTKYQEYKNKTNELLKEQQKKQKEKVAKRQRVTEKKQPKKDLIAQQGNPEQQSTMVTPIALVKQDADKNVVPSQVIAENQKERGRKKLQFEEAIQKQNDVTQEKSTTTADSIIVKQNPSKEKIYPQKLDFMNQIFTFVTSFYNTHVTLGQAIDANKNICDQKLKNELTNAPYVWIAILYEKIKNVLHSSQKDDLENGRTPTVLSSFESQPAQKGDLENSRTPTVVTSQTATMFLRHGEFNANICFFYVQSNELIKHIKNNISLANEKLVIGLDNQVDDIVLCDNAIKVMSANHVLQMLQKVFNFSVAYGEPKKQSKKNENTIKSLDNLYDELIKLEWQKISPLSLASAINNTVVLNKLKNKEIDENKEIDAELQKIQDNNNVVLFINNTESKNVIESFLQKKYGTDGTLSATGFYDKNLQCTFEKTKNGYIKITCPKKALLPYKQETFDTDIQTIPDVVFELKSRINVRYANYTNNSRIKVRYANYTIVSIKNMKELLDKMLKIKFQETKKLKKNERIVQPELKDIPPVISVNAVSSVESQGNQNNFAKDVETEPKDIEANAIPNQTNNDQTGNENRVEQTEVALAWWELLRQWIVNLWNSFFSN
ncbi:hypothetical protein EKK58_04640 [Candidatus Dependentiae bacterium]|nr:MAG: hypothetical protein EKK58_04640 [Candidatus Dependentiae bacterium]